jgi:hypothetical protein
MGKHITRKPSKVIPMPDSIIKRVGSMAIREKKDKTIMFSDRLGEPIPDLLDSPHTSGIDAAAGVND